MAGFDIIEKAARAAGLFTFVAIEGKPDKIPRLPESFYCSRKVLSVAPVLYTSDQYELGDACAEHLSDAHTKFVCRRNFSNLSCSKESCEIMTQSAAYRWDAVAVTGVLLLTAPAMLELGVVRSLIKSNCHP